MSACRVTNSISVRAGGGVSVDAMVCSVTITAATTTSTAMNATSDSRTGLTTTLTTVTASSTTIGNCATVHILNSSGVSVIGTSVVVSIGSFNGGDNAIKYATHNVNSFIGSVVCSVCSVCSVDRSRFCGTSPSGTSTR